MNINTIPKPPQQWAQTLVPVNLLFANSLEQLTSFLLLMSNNHSEIRLKPGDSHIGRCCPVSRIIFRVGDRVRVCQRCNVAFSAKHWAEVISMSNGQCPSCAKRIVTTHKNPKRGRKRFIPAPLWRMMIFGGLTLLIVVFFIGLSLSDRFNSGMATDKNEPNNISMENSNGVVAETEPMPTPTPQMPPPTQEIFSTTATCAPRPVATPDLPQITCPVVAKGAFTSLWHTHHKQLGCPLYAEPIQGQYTEIPFERGHLFWLGESDRWGDADRVIVIYGGQNEGDTGQWEIRSGTPDDDVSCPDMPPPPSGLYVPNGDNVKVWCEIDGPNKLGYATAPMKSVTRGVNALQNFEKAIVFRDSDGFSKGLAYILFWDSMTYVRVCH